MYGDEQNAIEGTLPLDKHNEAISNSGAVTEVHNKTSDEIIYKPLTFPEITDNFEAVACEKFQELEKQLDADKERISRLLVILKNLAAIVQQYDKFQLSDNTKKILENILILDKYKPEYKINSSLILSGCLDYTKFDNSNEQVLVDSIANFFIKLKSNEKSEEIIKLTVNYGYFIINNRFSEGVLPSLANKLEGVTEKLDNGFIRSNLLATLGVLNSKGLYTPSDELMNKLKNEYIFEQDPSFSNEACIILLNSIILNPKYEINDSKIFDIIFQHYFAGVIDDATFRFTKAFDVLISGSQEQLLKLTEAALKAYNPLASDKSLVFQKVLDKLPSLKKLISHESFERIRDILLLNETPISYKGALLSYLNKKFESVSNIITAENLLHVFKHNKNDGIILQSISSIIEKSLLKDRISEQVEINFIKELTEVGEHNLSKDLNKSLTKLSIDLEVKRLLEKDLTKELDSDFKNEINNFLSRSLLKFKESSFLSADIVDFIYLLLEFHYQDFELNILKLIEKEVSLSSSFPEKLVCSIANLLKQRPAEEILYKALIHLLGTKEGLFEGFIETFIAVLEQEKVDNEMKKEALDFITILIKRGAKLTEESKEKLKSIASVDEILNKTSEKIFEIAEKIGNEGLSDTNKGKTLDELLKEIGENKYNDSKIIDTNYLKTTFDKVNTIFNSKSILIETDKCINSWDKEDILSWSKEVKNTKKALEDNFFPEILAVIKRACTIFCGYDLRDVQVLSVLMILNSKDKGMLGQISTGEGKSTITAILAIINALKGYQVDVVTSSVLLAERDAEEKAGLYGLFDLKVGTNSEQPGTKEKGPKKCYGNEIVYGSTEDYQYDILKDEYNDQKTRAGRKFEVVIVDEVDSMTIDKGSDIAMVSSPIPASENLEKLFTLTWQELIRLKSCLTYDEKRDIWLYAHKETGNINHETREAVIEERFLEIININSFLFETLSAFLEGLILSQNLSTPKHLFNFSKNQIIHWVDSAIRAINMHEGSDYVITYDKKLKEHIIAPVDYSNTGIVNHGTSWVNGLHQFLQIKHSLKIHPETITTSFISNTAFFKRYGSKLYGITGTLGSDDAQSLLKYIYDIELCFVPTFKPKQFTEKEGIISFSKEEWINDIVDTTNKIAQAGRGILIICKTINDTKVVNDALIAGGIRESQIRLYSRSDNDEKDAVHEMIYPGQVIVATNLAGRGTDIKISDMVEHRGGLHVILTFIPDSLRVEQQAYGRCARQGEPGSAQIIVNLEDINFDIYKLQGNLTIESLKQLRDSEEFEKLEKVKNLEYHKLQLKDKLFEEFNQLRHELKGKDDSEIGKAKLEQLEELWGYFLKDLFPLSTNAKLFKLMAILKQYNLSMGRGSEGFKGLFESFYSQLVKYIPRDIKDVLLTPNDIEKACIAFISQNPGIFNYENEDKNTQSLSNIEVNRELTGLLSSSSLSTGTLIAKKLVSERNLIKAFSEVAGLRVHLFNPEQYEHEIIEPNNEDKSQLSSIFLAYQKLDDTPFNTYYSVDINDKDKDKDKELENVLSEHFQEVSLKLKKYTSSYSSYPLFHELYLKAKEKIIENYNSFLTNYTKEEFAKFVSENTARFSAGLKIFENPIYLIHAGLNLEVNQNYSQARELFELAIDLDENYSVAAHYYKAFVAVMEGKGEYKNEAFSSLAKTEALIENILKDNLDIIAITSEAKQDSELHQQIVYKKNVLEALLKSIKEAKSVIENCSSNKKVILGELSRITDLFQKSNPDYPVNELYELAGFGFVKTYSLKEVATAVDIWAVAFVFVVAGVQMAIALSSMASGNVQLATSMVMGCIRDTIKGFEAINGKQLDLSSFLTEKAIQCAITAISIGCEKALGIAGEYAAKGITTEIVMKVAGNVALNYATSFAIDYVSDSLSESALKDFKESLSKSLTLELDNLFRSKEISEKLGYLLGVDEFTNGKTRFALKLRESITTIFKHKQHHILTILNGVLGSVSSSASYGTGLGKALNVGAAAIKVGNLSQALDKINGLTTELCEKAAQAIREHYDRAPSINDMFALKLPMLDSQEVGRLIDFLKSNKVIEGNQVNHSGLGALNNVEFGEFKKHKLRVIEICKRYYQSQELEVTGGKIKHFEGEMVRMAHDVIYNRMQREVTKVAFSETISYAKDYIQSKIKERQAKRQEALKKSGKELLEESFPEQESRKYVRSKKPAVESLPWPQEGLRVTGVSSGSSKYPGKQIRENVRKELAEDLLDEWDVPSGGGDTPKPVVKKKERKADKAEASREAPPTFDPNVGTFMKTEARPGGESKIPFSILNINPDTKLELQGMMRYHAQNELNVEGGPLWQDIGASGGEKTKEQAKYQALPSWFSSEPRILGMVPLEAEMWQELGEDVAKGVKDISPKVGEFVARHQDTILDVYSYGMAAAQGAAFGGSKGGPVGAVIGGAAGVGKQIALDKATEKGIEVIAKKMHDLNPKVSEEQYAQGLIAGLMIQGNANALKEGLVKGQKVLKDSASKIGDLLTKGTVKAGPGGMPSTSVGKLYKPETKPHNPNNPFAKEMHSEDGGSKKEFKKKELDKKEVVIEVSGEPLPHNPSLLLPGEGKVGKFKELDDIGVIGDNLTPNHVPQKAFMEKYGKESVMFY